MKADQTSWHDVGPLELLEHKGVLTARIGGREIGVVATPDGLRAVRNRCPHQGGPLCEGRVALRLQGTPGNYDAGDRIVLRCPWHGWEFDLHTGRCPDDAAMRVAVYPVRIESGRVLVSTRPPAAHQPDANTEGAL